MTVTVHPTVDAANEAARALVTGWLSSPAVRNVMVAAGNTPLDLYQRIGLNTPNLSHLQLFALDEYVGVPEDEPRNCANLLRRTVAEPWRIPAGRFHTVSSSESQALDSIRLHERRIQQAGGLDVVILGLGQNGHIGFNEPGAAEDSVGRVLDLEPISIEANRLWFHGKHAPRQGVTVGMSTLLKARHLVVLAFGNHKAHAVRHTVEGPRSPACPASLLQGHPDAHLILDTDAASRLTRRP